MTGLVKQNSTQLALKFLMVLTSDHVTGATGITLTVTIRKEGGSFASPAGAITEIANGWFQVAGNATDTNTLGEILLHATGTGCDPTDRVVAQVVAFDPQDAVRAGLTALPNAAAEAAGGLYTRGSGAGQIAQSNNGRVDSDVKSIANAAIAAATFAANALDVGVRGAVGMASADLDTQLGLIASYIDTEVGAIKAKTDSLTFTVAGVLDANVVDWNGAAAPAMTGDAYAALTGNRAEPAQGAPAASTSMLAKLDYLYKAWRNKVTQTSSTYSLFADDATTVDQKATVADDGATFTRGEIASGP